MPGADSCRKQAQPCAPLARVSGDPAVAARYNAIALEYLAKAAERDAPARGAARGTTTAATGTAIDP